MKHPTQLEAILLGESKAIRVLRTQVRTAAATSLPILLCGPSGSGKELTAWAIHAASQRRGAFVPFNMSRASALIARDVPWDTPAVSASPTPRLTPGDFLDLGGGTIFLDEIAQLQSSSQSLLLQALKGHSLSSRRSAADPHTGLRLISATSTSPKELLQTGVIQERLLRRLGGMTITIPSLAERRKDIPTLALYFLSLLPAAQRPLGYTAAAMRRLQAFDWPGNVRDLKRVVTAAARLAPGEMLDDMAVEFARKTTDCGTQIAKPGATRRLLPTKPPSRYSRLIPSPVQTSW
jgi:DNA-binding NtrC family response regulator